MFVGLEPSAARKKNCEMTLSKALSKNFVRFVIDAAGGNPPRRQYRELILTMSDKATVCEQLMPKPFVMSATICLTHTFFSRACG